MAKEEKETKKKTTKKETTTKKDNKKSNVHEVVIKIEGEHRKKAQDVAFKKRQKTVKVDGFRTGKVPRNVFEKKFGKESLYLDAADSLVEMAYFKAMEDSKLIPVVKPNVNITNIGEDGVEFTFTITTAPTVKVKKYSGLNIKPDKVEVTEEEINHELGHLLERYTELVNKEKGKVEEGDIAIIDFEGFKDGVAFDGGKGENYSLEIGSHTFIPGFEEKVVGMKIGEEKDLDLEFPEDYGAKDLAGAKVVFKVKVNEIKQKVTRELDEDFFDDLGMEGIDSEDKLREEIKNSIKAQKELDNENKYVEALLEAISKNVEVDIPEEMVEEELDRLIKRFEEQMKMQGISLDLYYQFTGSDEKALRNQMEKEAYSNVLAKKYQMKKDEFLHNFGGLDMVKYDLQIRETVEKLKELNK